MPPHPAPASGQDDHWGCVVVTPAMPTTGMRTDRQPAGGAGRRPVAGIRARRWADERHGAPRSPAEPAGWQLLRGSGVDE